MTVTEEQLTALAERVTKCEMYEVGHDAKIDAYWAAQFKLNDEIKRDFKGFTMRLTALEKRVVYLSAVAAAAGAAVAGLIPWAFTLLAG